MIKINTIFLICFALLLILPGNSSFAGEKMSQDSGSVETEKLKIQIVDTGQVECYDNWGAIAYPRPGKPFYGQDAQYEGNNPSYKDNGDGTITDLITGLMWSKAVDETKVSLIEAGKIAQQMRLGGYSDWRVPNIKELYSLIDFRGNTGNSQGSMNSIPNDSIPFIDTDYFDFRYGQVENGERYIDGQWLSGTKYVSTTMGGAETLFGVNFVDGRIKGYGYKIAHGYRPEKKFYARYVRGKSYGANDYVDNGDGTITDRNTGLMWMQKDSGKSVYWKEALEYAEKLVFAGHDDWRLPNAKELQYIVDYSRSPDTTDSPAIDPVFHITEIRNEDGKKDYPYIWTSTTHLGGPQPGTQAAYIAFGRGLGKMHGRIMDVHGAGAQRSDPKMGNPTSRGPQGDIVRVKNFVLCVRGGSPVKQRAAKVSEDKNSYPYNLKRDRYAAGKSQKGSRQMPRNLSPGKRFIERLDKDGDGKVSRAEFDGPADRFGYHDKNNDGYITEDEAPQGPPPRRRIPRD